MRTNEVTAYLQKKDLGTMKLNVMGANYVNGLEYLAGRCDVLSAHADTATAFDMYQGAAMMLRYLDDSRTLQQALNSFQRDIDAIVATEGADNE